MCRETAPRTSSTTLELLLPDGARAQTSAQLRETLKRPQERARLRAEMLALLHAEGWDDFSFARAAYCPSDISLNGLTVAQLPSRLTPGRPPTAAGRVLPPVDEPAVVSEAVAADGPAEPPPATPKEMPAAKETPAATQQPAPALPWHELAGRG